MSRSVYIINGPNLNLLGQREVEIYGKTDLAKIEANCRKIASNNSVNLDFFQSNSETEIINLIQQAIAKKINTIIINAAGYSHTSVAILDALKSFKGLIIEVHLSNPHKREKFRHSSYISQIADGVICGLQEKVYYLALEAIFEKK